MGTGKVKISEKSPLMKLTELLEEKGFFFSKLEASHYDSDGNVMAIPHTIDIRIHPVKERFRWVSLDEKNSVIS
jgi:hypothetical protein